MKLKINLIFLTIYLIGISIVLKKFYYIPLGIAALLFIFDGKISEDIKNLIYLIVALTPFLPFLAILLIYLPFSIFGNLLNKADFIKRYLFGFAIFIFSTLMIYTISMFFGFSLNIFTISLIFYIPIIFIIYKVYKKKNIHELIKIDSNNYKIIIISLFFLFFIANVMLNNNTLFMSNGTYFYSKYYTIVKSIERTNTFPFYAPYSAQGEQIFLLDSPAFFSHIGFIKILLPWLNPVLFFNYYSVFLLFLTILGASLLIREVISNKIDNVSTYIIAIGSSAIVLSFIFIQYLESVKHFFATPIGLLAFALILSNPRKINCLIIIFSLLILSALIHPAHSLGIILISLFTFILIQFDKNSILRNFGEFKEEIIKNKFKVILLIFLILVPLFYFIPNLYYSDFLKEGSTSIDSYLPNAIFYVKSFFTTENPLSIKYPDLSRVDDKKIGFLISAFGLFALVYSLLNIKKSYFTKANKFILAYFLSVIASSIVVNFPFLNKMEYGYKTLVLYALVLLIVLTCTVINSFKQNILRWILLIVFLSGFIYSLPYIKTNLSNIHQESFIGGETYKNEIEFIKNLPVDGRIITYGHFSNAVDAGLHALTDRYLARYEFKQIDASRTIYDKIHTSHSWGYFEDLEKIPNEEFANYLRIGGYKYLFLSICHPVGQVVLNKVYPNFTYPIYQNQCNLFMVVNDTYYAEKVNVVSDQERETMKKNKNGHLYISINKDFNKWYKTDYPAEYARLKEPEPLVFERPKPPHVIIKGDFKDNEWVVFKEQYFPRWKAYIDGKEVPVLSTNNDLILIKTVKGKEIVLKNVLMPVEKISGFLSSIGILLFFVLLIVMF